ncbi:hypothetical protein FB45DRAFT_831183 [Roridomyces roridus]|uniref:Uncharacterized protein n=1 Tax=Roridomyces roridus TaxID=1738132 RepID=A0AAD7BW08_9AGAR|nr:hypothetical protein FB45DRAFT_831183 [Roridomyces roridus]
MPAERPIPVWSRRYKELNKPMAKEEKAPQRSATRSLFLGYNCHETRRAHYFLFIPYLIDDAKTGKLINVSGNPWNSDFTLEIKTGFDRKTSPVLGPTRSHYIYLGEISADDFVDEEHYNIRNTPNANDRIESIAASIPLPYRAPGATPEHPDDPMWLRPHPRLERCQEWTNRLVQSLVDAGLLGASALMKMSSAHKAHLCDECAASRAEALKL